MKKIYNDRYIVIIHVASNNDAYLRLLKATRHQLLSRGLSRDYIIEKTIPLDWFATIACDYVMEYIDPDGIIVVADKFNSVVENKLQQLQIEGCIPIEYRYVGMKETKSSTVLEMIDFIDDILTKYAPMEEEFDYDDEIDYNQIPEEIKKKNNVN